MKKQTNIAEKKEGIKFQIDTANKTIKVEGTVKISELMKHLKAMLPKGSPFGCYDEYSLEFNTTIQWYNYPVIINPAPYGGGNWWDQQPVWVNQPVITPANPFQPFYDFSNPYCGDFSPQTNVGDNGTYSVNVGGAVCVNNVGAISNVVVLNPDTPITYTSNNVTADKPVTVFNVLLN